LWTPSDDNHGRPNLFGIQVDLAKWVWQNLGMTTDQVQPVRDALTAYQLAKERAEDTLAALHAAIAEAAGQGVRQNELVKITGYTRERIRQISRQPPAGTAPRP
jgi:hypothetical protein